MTHGNVRRHEHVESMGDRRGGETRAELRARCVDWANGSEAGEIVGKHEQIGRISSEHIGSLHLNKIRISKPQADPERSHFLQAAEQSKIKITTRTRAQHADRAQVVVGEQAIHSVGPLRRPQTGANEVWEGGGGRERGVERTVPEHGDVGAGARPLRRVDERFGELGARAANDDLRQVWVDEE